ncbi:MAG: hypothetical protein WCY24_08555 [Lutispora sp.]|nr:hypothetical protein [Lutispora sp.]MDD4833525.1 hypothetical protein [Lutispora sp.]
MSESVLLIGYRLNDALSKLHHDKEIILEITKAPSKNGDKKFDYSNPIVVKHKESEKRVVLTVSYFK